MLAVIIYYLLLLLSACIQHDTLPKAEMEQNRLGAIPFPSSLGRIVACGRQGPADSSVRLNQCVVFFKVS